MWSSIPPSRRQKMYSYRLTIYEAMLKYSERSSQTFMLCEPRRSRGGYWGVQPIAQLLPDMKPQYNKMDDLRYAKAVLPSRKGTSKPTGC